MEERILSYLGFLGGEYLYWNIAGTVLIYIILGFKGAPIFLWTLVTAIVLVGFDAPIWLFGLFVGVGLFANVTFLRRLLISSVIMKMIRKVVPPISETERVALEAGVVWAEGELFSGHPDVHKLMNEPYPELTEEEQAFLDGPVEELCAATNDWKIWKEKEIPEPIWEIIRREKFFGLCIPKKYGGLEFSPMAHSEVIMKIVSRSVPVCITVMVPNSLGPAELLMHYGTEEQKNRWLPKLASGEEIPCFGLTEPQAGSDAGSITSSGVLFKDEKGVIKIRLNWNKRWITLAALSTVIGLAFRLKDPDNLLGQGEDLGITCGLVPSHSKGVVLGRRHDPMGVPFYNCPTQGHDVVLVAEDVVIGGLKNAGKGWKMLMDSLAAGRGISLPAQSAGGAKAITRGVSAHASIRKQFGVAIGRFEGIEESLARIGGWTYLIEAMRKYTCGALNKDIKPPVVTAMTKYNATELGRALVNDAMDILAGAGISRGPRNIISGHYMSAPIAVTVEGANILTRTLMIFGQGALRAHPYAFQVIKAIEENELKSFDKAFWGHTGHIVQNFFRSLVLSLSRGYLADSGLGGPVGRYFQKIAWASASFAIITDIAMGALGGSLKKKEKIAGRFADIMSWLYMITATLRHWKAQGKQKEDLPLVHYICRNGFREIERAFDGVYSNLRIPGLSWFLARVVRSWSAVNTFLSSGVSDELSSQVANIMLTDSAQRDRLTQGIFIPKDKNEDGIGRLENAFKIIKASEGVERKVKQAIRAKKLPKVKKLVHVAEEALTKGIINQRECDDLKLSAQVRWEAIQVDSFALQDFVSSVVESTKEPLPPRPES